MKKLLLAALGTMVLSSIASATILTTYSTAGSTLSCGSVGISCSGSGTSALTFILGSETLTLSYNANSDSNIDGYLNGFAANTSWGSLTPTFTGTGDQSFNITGVTLQLMISATTATGTDPVQLVFGAATVNSLLSIVAGNTTAQGGFTFTSPFSQALAGTISPAVTATVTSGQTSISFGNPSTIQGTILAPDVPSGVPEPSSLLMTGAALLGFGAMKFRKRA